MIFSARGILEVLEKIPEWLGLKKLPARMEALEQRVAALEARLTETPKGLLCPVCQSPMRVLAVSADPTFGVMGLQRHQLKCESCGHTESRQVDPRK